MYVCICSVLNSLLTEQSLEIAKYDYCPSALLEHDTTLSFVFNGKTDSRLLNYDFTGLELESNSRMAKQIVATSHLIFF
jgi:hypothetical protein